MTGGIGDSGNDTGSAADASPEAGLIELPSWLQRPAPRKPEVAQSHLPRRTLSEALREAQRAREARGGTDSEPDIVLDLDRVVAEPAPEPEAAKLGGAKPRSRQV